MWRPLPCPEVRSDRYRGDGRQDRRSGRGQQRMPNSYSLGLDVGGTFTDFVLLDDINGDVYVHKHLTSYPDVSAGVLAGLYELLGERAIPLSAVRVIVHSTTLVTNALIER